MTNNNDHKGGHGHSHILELIIDGKKHVWHHQYITESELRKLGSISVDYDIYLAIEKPWHDEHIVEGTTVDLARPGIEHFYVKEKPVEFVIMVNSRPKKWNERTISFEQVIELAYGSHHINPDKIYTVTYDLGPKQNPEGSMVKGTVVFVKNKMSFNAAEADKS